MRTYNALMLAAVMGVLARTAVHGAETSAAGLFPNDAGPAQLDVSKYPADMQARYKVFARKCSTCHTLARPINTQFLELTAEERKAAKEKEPEILSDEKIWSVGDTVWSRYVKRMKSKPGCTVGSDAKAIWEFLVFDSKLRKTGANREAWRAHRRKLVDDFKKASPEAYEKLWGKQGAR